LGPVRIAIPEENTQFPCRECHTGRGCGRPPLEAALGEAFGAEPKALAIIGQEFERRAGAVPKDVDGTAQGIVAQCLTTQGSEAVYPLPEINRMDGQKDATLGRELEH